MEFLKKLWPRLDPAKRTAGQNALMQAVRLTDNKDIEAVIARSSIDDLEWFIQILDSQREASDRWAQASERLEKFQAWIHRVRGLTVQVLHNKRTQGRLRRWALDHANQLLGYVLTFALGSLLTWALTRN